MTFLWQVFDPHSIEFSDAQVPPSLSLSLLTGANNAVRSSFQTRRPNMDTIVLDQIYYCKSKYRPKLLPFIYLYKSSLLVVGGYLAAKTRHVHISALNDSKFIVWSIYTVVLTSVFTVTIMLSIQNLRTYVVLCFVVLLMKSFIICLVFVPKVGCRRW